MKSVSLRSVLSYLTLPQRTFLQSANYVRTELPVRIAHRIRDLQDLPYTVVMQEGVAKVYEVRYTVPQPTSLHDTAHWQLYWSAFEKYARPPSTEKLHIGHPML